MCSYIKIFMYKQIITGYKNFAQFFVSADKSCKSSYSSSHPHTNEPKHIARFIISANK